MLYLVTPGGASIVGSEGEILLFWFSRAQQNAFPAAFLRFAMVCLKGTNCIWQIKPLSSYEACSYKRNRVIDVQ